MSALVRRVIVVLALSSLSAGCIGTVIGQTTSAAIEVAKVPFKVGGAVVDVATGDDDDEKDKKDD